MKNILLSIGLLSTLLVGCNHSPGVKPVSPSKTHTFSYINRTATSTSVTVDGNCVSLWSGQTLTINSGQLVSLQSIPGAFYAPGSSSPSSYDQLIIDIYIDNIDDCHWNQHEPFYYSKKF